MSSVFKAIADPTRRQVLALLREGPMSAGELADRFDVSKPTMSAHFNVLREAGLIDASKHGKSIVYRLRMSVLEEALMGLAATGRARPRRCAQREGEGSMTAKQKELTWGLIGAAILILLPLGAIAARTWGIVEDPGHDLPGRLYGIAAGLIIAAYGNVAPRKLVRYDPGSTRPARTQAAIRFSGWAFVLAGLAHALIWATVSPIDLATLLSMVPLALGLGLVLYRCTRVRVEQA